MTISGLDLSIRPRRLRTNDKIRSLVCETMLNPNDFIYPLFIKAGLTAPQAIKSMPDQYQLNLDSLEQEVEQLLALGIKSVLLFGIPTSKDETGSDSYNDNGIIQQALAKLEHYRDELLIICDSCFCEYTSHGHCGVLNSNDIVNNDETIELLAKQAVSMAQTGADIIAPSGMMDGMVAAIRRGLDNHGFDQTPIMSYAVKYASSFYGPFRDAAEGAPSFGDRKSYQMNPANSQEALREAQLDIEQGADMLMVKPAMNYLDIIKLVNLHYPQLPLFAYQVSGEYSMIKGAAKNGLIDEEQAMLESLIAIKRAGAKGIITYFAKQAAKSLR